MPRDGHVWQWPLIRFVYLLDPQDASGRASLAVATCQISLFKTLRPLELVTGQWERKYFKCKCMIVHGFDFEIRNLEELAKQ